MRFTEFCTRVGRIIHSFSSPLTHFDVLVLMCMPHPNYSLSPSSEVRMSPSLPSLVADCRRLFAVVFNKDLTDIRRFQTNRRAQCRSENLSSQAPCALAASFPSFVVPLRAPHSVAASSTGRSRDPCPGDETGPLGSSWLVAQATATDPRCANALHRTRC